MPDIICKFANIENGKTNQKCMITDEDCVFGFLFPDSVECFDKYKIYPEYSFYIDVLKNMYRDEQKTIKGKWITKKNVNQFTISHNPQIYSINEIIKIILNVK